MDMQMEDKYVQQIEQNLPKQMELDLFATGKINQTELKPRKLDPVREREPVREIVPVKQTGELIGTRNLLASDVDKEPVVETRDVALGPMITRAEYIRQAREACLRQMIDAQSLPQQGQIEESATNGYDSLYPRTRLREESYWNTPAANNRKQDASPQEMASFRSLVIRTACAAVICVAVIVIDLLDIKLGGVSTDVVREYVVGKDYLKIFEEAIVTLIKK